MSNARSARTPSGRVHSSKDTEKRVLESALTLFSEKGYDGVSIREIIERAGVTRPVLYYYFESKEDLFFRLVQASFAEFNRFVDEIVAQVPGCRDRLRALMAMAFQQAEESPEVVRLILQVFSSGHEEGIHMNTEALLENRLDRLVGIMRDGLASGELRGGDADTLALVFSGIMDIHIMAKTHRTEARLTSELAEGLVDIFMNGASPTGLNPEPVQCPFAPLANAATSD